MEAREYQKQIIKETFQALRDNRKVLIVAATGAGKCHGKGTPILMADGNLKKVEDIYVGDKIAGDDNKPRTVLELARGQEEMFLVTPVKGDSFTVNKSHILSLRVTGRPGTKQDCGYVGGQIVNISVEDYLLLSKTQKHVLKLYRTGYDYPARSVSFSPYVLGIWLGDGTSCSSQITTMDKEIVEAVKLACPYDVVTFTQKNENQAGTINIRHAANKPGFRNPFRRNSLLDFLKDNELLNNKHIPLDYLTNSREVRLELLAGLLDSDGHLSRGGFEFAQKSDVLTSQVLQLARSLGFAAYSSDKYINGVKYNRVYISGDVSLIPCRLPRKQAQTRKQIKNVLNTGFALESIGVGDYYGFEIDGNHLYLLGDFTVTHNSLILSKLAELSIKANKRVLIIAHRLKLLKQINETFEGVSGAAGSMIAPGYKSDYSNPLQLAMVQTLGSKTRVLPDNIDIILVDECHLTTSFAGFERVMNHCNGSIWALGKTKLVGLTGTPYRNNKKEGLCRWFNHIIQAPTGRQLMNDGYLTPPDIYTYASGSIDLDNIKIDSATGDFSVKEAIAACTPDYLIDVFEKWYSVNPKAKTIVFCAGIQQTEIMLGLFQSKGISACSLTGEASEADCTKIYTGFESGLYQVLVNCMKLTEGFDSPSIQSVLLARPTRSLALGIQMIGRGTRLFEGKKTFDFIDCGGFIEYFMTKGIYDVFAIDKFNIHPRYKVPGELPTKQCPSCEQHVNVFALICPHCATPFPAKVKEQSMIFFPDLIKLDAENLKTMKAEYRFARKEMEKIFSALGDIRDLEKRFFTKFKKLPNKEFLRGALFNGNDDDLTRSVFSHYLAGCVGTHSELIKHYFRLEFGDDRLVKPFSPAGYLGVRTPPGETTSEIVNRLYSEKLETHNPVILNYSYLAIMKRIS